MKQNQVASLILSLALAIPAVSFAAPEPDMMTEEDDMEMMADSSESQCTKQAEDEGISDEEFAGYVDDCVSEMENDSEQFDEVFEVDGDIS
jgi:hypothetical protein